MCGIGRKSGARLVIAYDLLHQSRVEWVETRGIHALGAVIVLAVRGRRKIERRKLRLAKSQRYRGPDHDQSQGDGRSNHHAP